MTYLKDEDFIRGKCPMTKEEVRILTMTKLNLREDSKLLDVGTGTGTIAVQGSLLCPKGKVVTIERDEDAIEAALQNIEKFQCTNLQLIRKDAIEALEDITEKFDSIFIGGSGGVLREIIQLSYTLLKEAGVMVLNFVTIDNVYKAMNELKKLNMEVACTQVSVSKTKGDSYMLFSNNPIFIVEAKKR